MQDARSTIQEPASGKGNNTAAITSAFRGAHGLDPQVFFAPGRINLIGEHTDYTGGFVLPAAIAFGTWIAVHARADRVVRVRSATQSETVEIGLDVEPRAARKHWSDYAAGVVWALQAQHRDLQLCGAELLIHNDVPLGAGLSSSASMEVCVALALLGVARQELGALNIALACQRAENEFAGARCGIMDQFIATHARPDHAVLLDCDSLQSRLIPLARTHRWIVANTGVRHALAGGEYNLRRAECEEVLAQMAQHYPQRRLVRELLHEEQAALATKLSPVAGRRLAHLCSENRRVGEMVVALERCEMRRAGELLFASHASLRDDFEVSCAELDLMVAIASRQPGVLGARMMGGGFGGSTLALVDTEASERVILAMRRDYLAEAGIEPEIFAAQFSGAAGKIG
ncbi:MAG: galactokinase [Alphaproteobacteria bacterium]|nr:galactokinase [Alphaproteobacteria bacterium]